MWVCLETQCTLTMHHMFADWLQSNYLSVYTHQRFLHTYPESIFSFLAQLQWLDPTILQCIVSHSQPLLLWVVYVILNSWSANYRPHWTTYTFFNDIYTVKNSGFYKQIFVCGLILNAAYHSTVSRECEFVWSTLA